MPFRYPTLRDRLNANSREHVLRDDLDKPCRVWTGKLNSAGYGMISMRNGRAGKKKNRLAHRVSLAESLGVPVWRLRVVRHKCDCKPCIEPSHLLGGTYKQNERDKIERGRHRNGHTGKLQPRAEFFRGLAVY